MATAKKAGKAVAVAEQKPASPSDRLNAIGIDVICECIASGESLRSWCIANGFNLRTTNDWIDADKTRSAHYARARDDRADAVFEALDEVSERAVMAGSAIEVAGLRLKADNIKWKLARMNAKKYGDKVTNEVTGADGGAVQLVHTVNLVPMRGNRA